MRVFSWLRLLPPKQSWWFAVRASGTALVSRAADALGETGLATLVIGAEVRIDRVIRTV
jgi:hypothetical protein